MHLKIVLKIGMMHVVVFTGNNDDCSKNMCEPERTERQLIVVLNEGSYKQNSQSYNWCLFSITSDAFRYLRLWRFHLQRVFSHNFRMLLDT